MENWLSPSLCATLENQGFVIVPDVLSAGAVDSVIVGMENLRLSNLTVDSGYAMRHLARTVPAVKEITKSAPVRRLVETIVGDSGFLARSIFFDKTPEANWKVAWHQDLTIAVRKRIDAEGYSAWSVKEGIVHVQPPMSVLEQMVTIRLHLDDCGLENGPLQVIPGSHKESRLDSRQIGAWRLREKPIHCVVPRGGALLMRPLLLHASSAATKPAHRRVVHLEFAAQPLPGGLEWETLV